jgi:hypothetical protein
MSAVIIMFATALVLVGSQHVQAQYNFGTSIEKVDDVAKKGYGDDVTKTDLQSVIGAVIRAALTLVGAIFLVMMVYGGYNWMIDRGDSERVKIAKDTITRALIGIVIVMGAYAITNFITGRLAETASGGAAKSTQYV